MCKLKTVKGNVVPGHVAATCTFKGAPLSLTRGQSLFSPLRFARSQALGDIRPRLPQRPSPCLSYYVYQAGGTEFECIVTQIKLCSLRDSPNWKEAESWRNQSWSAKRCAETQLLCVERYSFSSCNHQTVSHF